MDIRVVVSALMARHGVAQGHAIAAIEEKSEIGAGEQRDPGPENLDMWQPFGAAHDGDQILATTAYFLQKSAAAA